MTIDAIDQALLSLLQGDSRLPHADLARRLGIARGTVQARLARLEKTGIISAYTIRTTGARHGVEAYVSISLQPSIAEEARTEAGLRRIDAVKALWSVAGPNDWLAHMTAPDAAALGDAIDRIRTLPGVAATVSQIVLNRKFER